MGYLPPTTIASALAQIQAGELILPAIQREYVWEADQMHLVTLATTDGHVAQRSATTADQKTILAALELPEPARFFDFTVPDNG